MGASVTFIQSLLHQSPEIALFLALAGGYWIGKFQFGKFQLGGVAGSLLVAVLISQIGVTIDNMADTVIAEDIALNKSIRDDKRNLGPGFEIGHSYFVPSGEDENLDDSWFRAVIRTEIAPLLKEYWFDQPARVDEELAHLLA